MDIRDEIDRSFGPGPDDDADLGELLVAGRRALLRRRLTVGAGALATAAILGGTTWAATGAGGDRADDVPVATSPGHPSGVASPSDPATTTSTTASATPSATPGRPAADVGRKPTRKQYQHVVVDLMLVGYDEHGRVVVDPRATVVDRVDNPFHLEPPQDSVAVAVRFQGSVWWYATSYAGDGSSNSTVTWAGNYDGSFTSWARGQNGIAGPPESVGDPVLPGITYIDLVDFVGDTEKLAPVEGATILEQRPHVSVGDSFAGPNDHTAVAEVRAADGQVYYVLARSFDGKPGQYIAVPRARGGATIDDFLAMARQRYAEGGGGLL